MGQGEDIQSKYTLTPKSLMQGLAQIGGLMSFLGIAIVAVRWYHREHTNKELDRYLESLDIGEKDGRSFYSYENFTKTVARVAELERKLKEQEI